MSSTPATPIVGTADTFGWDTVFAIHIDEVNAAIATAGSSPKSFSIASQDEQYKLSGTFGTWQIVPGGAGSIVVLSVPFTNADLRMPDGSTMTIAGSASVNVQLAFLHADEVAASGGMKKLVVQSTPSDAGKVATVVGMSYSGQAPSFLGDIATRTMLEQWLNQNLSYFDHVFATVNVDRQASAGAFQWMQPTDVAYAYCDDGLTDGVFAVLCMTESRRSTGLAQQISPTVLPTTCRGAFLISKERLIEKFLLPAVPRVFSGSQPGDFVLSSTGDSIVPNGSRTVSFQATSNGSTHQATLTQFLLGIVGTELQMNSTTVVSVAIGVSAKCESQNFLSVGLVTKSDGSQTLSFRNSRPPIVVHSTEKSPGLELAQEVLTDLAIAASVLAVVCTGGAALVGAALVFGVLSSGLMAATAIVEDVGMNEAPSIDAMMLDAMASITWPDADGFFLTTAGLSDSLQLGGLFRKPA